MSKISLDSLKAEVKKHLSVIGKRTYTKDGQNMFSNITVSTAEDPIIENYLEIASQAVYALIHPFVTTWSISRNAQTLVLELTLELENARNDSDFETKAKGYIESFMTLSATGDYLAMTHPDIARKYKEDSTGAMQVLMTYVFYKHPITPTADPLSPTVTVTDTEPNTDTDTVTDTDTDTEP